MATRININEQRLLDWHEAQKDDIYLRYFHPDSIGTNIPHYRITPDELAEMSEFDAMGRELGRGLGRGNGHKCANFHRDPDFCNGLPRRRGR